VVEAPRIQLREMSDEGDGRLPLAPDKTMNTREELIVGEAGR